MNKVTHKLYGAILGDLMGQPFEFPPMQSFNEDSPVHNPDAHITDDTLMTLASARYLLDRDNKSIEQEMKIMGNKYKGDYYGKNFRKWLGSAIGTIGNSWGNGCLMRVSPYFYVGDTESQVIEEITLNCNLSHSHLKSSLALKELINVYIDDKRIKCIYPPAKKFTKFEVGAEETIHFIKQVYFNGGKEDSLHNNLKKIIGCGGDTDTNASIFAELHNYKNNSITEEDVKYVESKLDPYLLSILKEFNNKY